MRVTVVLTSIAAVLHSTVAFSPLLPCHDGFRQQRVTRHRLDRARCSGGGNGSRFALEEDNDEGPGEYDRLTFEDVPEFLAAAVFVCILFSLCACNAVIMGTRDVFDDIRDVFNKVKVDVGNNHDSVYVGNDVGNGVDDDVDNGVGDDVDDDVDDNDPLFPPRIAAIIERVKMTRSISDIRFTNAGTLVLDIPPRGMTVRSAMIGASLSTAGLFVVGSLSGPLVSGVYGGFVAKFMVVNPFVSTHITIGQHTWSLERRYCGDTDAFTESSTDQLVRASLKTKSSMFSDEMEGKLYLYTKKPRMRKVRLAAGLPLEEQQLLEGVINDYLDHRSCGDSE